MAANFCMNCGARLEPGTRFCMVCGAAIPQDPEAVNPLQSGTIPTVTLNGSPSASNRSSANNVVDPSTLSSLQGDMQTAAEPSAQTDFTEGRTQLIGIPPFETASAQEEAEREQFHEAEIESGTWNESSPASYRRGSSDEGDTLSADETRVMSWTESAPDGTCTIPFASQKPEAADLFEPPEVDLSGFDVPAQPHYDIDDGSVAAWGTAAPDSTFVADGWEDDRPAGYTGGLKQESTTQMPADMDPMTGVKRSNTMVMDPITAQGVYTTPATNQTVYSSDNTARRGSGTKVAIIVIVVLLVFAAIYLIQFNPYFLQNLQYDFSQWAQGQGVELVGNIYGFFSGIVNQLALIAR